MLLSNPDRASQLINDDKPIVGGAIFGDSLSGMDIYIKNVAVKMDYTQKLIQVDKMGLGFCLVKREVLDKTYVLFRQEPIFHFAAKADPLSTEYEDMYFFDKVREIGYRPWVDLRARIIHLKQVGLTPEGSMIPSGQSFLGDQYFEPWVGSTKR